MLYKVSVCNEIKVETVKSTSVAIEAYWFDAKSGLLVVAKSGSKPGQMLTFRLNDAKTVKRLEGPKFALEVGTSRPIVWSGATNQGGNGGKQDANHCCAIGKLYESVYFAHFSVSDGLFRLYQFANDAIAVTFGPISVPESSFSTIRMIDSLIIIENPSSSTDFIYDIKTPWCIRRPFCRVSYKTPENPSELPSNTVPGNVFHSERYLSTVLSSPDHDIFLDTSKGRCYKAHISALALVQNLNKKLDAVLFLMRRVGGKYEALGVLRKCLVEGAEEVEHICGFFEALRTVHFDVASEGNPILKAIKRGKNEENARKIDPEDEKIAIKRAEMDICRSFQREMCELVLTGFCAATNIDPKYQIAVLLEFARSFCNQDLPLTGETQLQIAKFLLSHRDFAQFQDLVEYGVITATAEVCELLTNYWLGEDTKDWSAGVVLVDIMHSLKLGEDLSLLLSDAGLDYEASVCLPTPEPEFQRSPSLTHISDAF